MNTNEHEYYLGSRMLFGCHFLASIREDSRSFLAKILFLEIELSQSLRFSGNHSGQRLLAA